MSDGPSAATSPTYRYEFHDGARPLAAACLGLIAGTISIYLNNLFSPSLIQEFGWTKAQFSTVGLTTAISVVFLPIAGRLADRFGMRRIALIGVTALPLVFLALAVQTGSFALFFLLSTLQMLIISALAGIIVYGRLLVAYFSRARGLALGIASCAPAVVTIVMGPLLSRIIEAQGWRTGYAWLALGSALLGATALLLVPRSFSDADPRPRGAGNLTRDYGELLTTRAFLVIFSAMLLCNIHFTLQTTQLALILAERGIDASAAGTMLSLFALGVIGGRILCGLALDRFTSRMVASICFLVPALSLGLLSTETADARLAGLAIAGLGFSVGAEGDIAAYLATRYFRPELFSSVLGLFTSAMAVSALLGAFAVNRVLAITGSYSSFLAIAATCVLVGALLFQMLGSEQPVLTPEGHGV